ncbi:secondary thiamine-phosphate synthase enzyme YjbQ [Salinibius halmophilus]|uniref:secondary thiamine-phosphate synthase enzyme YjbQ n=1 Tax=Salinibius halmophilus TaxID=1853216 RepID=UPI000E66E716|nr:secondary thiamine-phosphate synthase enzyme YjbQ [Salinibius halmophilus]
MWIQRQISIPAKKRGYHLIDKQVRSALPELSSVQQGLLQLQVLHTSASLFITENADPDVLVDFETILNRMVPEHQQGLLHTLEGADDMPAHIKSALLGSQLTLQVNNGNLVMGTWQGVCLGEHRNHGGTRTIAATLISS